MIAFSVSSDSGPLTLYPTIITEESFSLFEVYFSLDRKLQVFSCLTFEKKISIQLSSEKIFFFKSESPHSLLEANHVFLRYSCLVTIFGFGAEIQSNNFFQKCCQYFSSTSHFKFDWSLFAGVSPID